MSREIKFRAWSKNNKQMYPQTGDGGTATFAIQPDGSVTTWGVYTRLELMQYTGLLDKNGKEIYEGDIVTNEHGTKMQVIYNIDEKNAKWCGKVHEFDSGTFIMGWFFANESEVIGNIYENPELLEVTK